MARQSTAVRRGGPVDKRDLLLFDHVAVMGLEDEISRLYGVNKAGAADLEYLANVGAVQAAPTNGSQLADAIRLQLATELQPLLAELDESGLEWPVGDGTRRDMLLEAELIASSGRHPASRFQDQPLPRGSELLVAFLARLQGDDAVAVFDRSPTQVEWRDLSRSVVVPKSLRGSNHSARVADLVLNWLPLPSEDTALEAVLDFVNDPDVRSQAESLRLWMRKIARDSENLDDIELELETLLHELRQHLRLHKLKTRDSTLRTVLSIPLGVAQELLHLRPQGAIDALFAVRERRAMQLEVRLTAPGHEVAFIDTAWEAFSS